MEPDFWKQRMEERVGKLEQNHAALMETLKHSDRRFDTLERRLDKIDGHLTWVTRLIGGAIILGFISFMLGGNLNV